MDTDDRTDNNPTTTLRAVLGDKIRHLETYRVSRWAFDDRADHGPDTDTFRQLDSIRYQHLENENDTAAATLVGHDALGFSDYSGSMVERANVRVIEEMADEQTAAADPAELGDVSLYV